MSHFIYADHAATTAVSDTARQCYSGGRLYEIGR